MSTEPELIRIASIEDLDEMLDRIHFEDGEFMTRDGYMKNYFLSDFKELLHSYISQVRKETLEEVRERLEDWSLMEHFGADRWQDIVNNGMEGEHAALSEAKEKMVEIVDELEEKDAK